MAYVGGSAKSAECVFCVAAAGDDDVSSLILHRGEHVFVIMNLFPYNTGHLMVVPYDHVNDLAALSVAARSELIELTAAFTTGLTRVMGSEGINLGMNLGAAAGAGIADHLHQHLVPRWIGDANFMPLVGGTKVLPELLPATY
ncbi:MAG TPA: HIT domain-containing protein, partial [Thermomicrobiales bacterium]|nr:HIT domain-containing protein [Thermomicrobiales bacterium]